MLTSLPPPALLARHMHPPAACGGGFISGFWFVVCDLRLGVLASRRSAPVSAPWPLVTSLVCMLVCGVWSCGVHGAGVTVARPPVSCVLCPVVRVFISSEVPSPPAKSLGPFRPLDAALTSSCRPPPSLFQPATATSQRGVPAPWPAVLIAFYCPAALPTHHTPHITPPCPSRRGRPSAIISSA